MWEGKGSIEGSTALTLHLIYLHCHCILSIHTNHKVVLSIADRYSCMCMSSEQRHRIASVADVWGILPFSRGELPADEILDNPLHTNCQASCSSPPLLRDS